MSPGDFVGPDAAGSYSDLATIGWLPGTDSPCPLAYVDPIEDPTIRGDEDERGVAVWRHPEAALRDDPELHDVVDRMRAGCPLEISHAEYDSLSAWEIDARLIMLAARRRDESRQMKRMRDNNG